MTPQELKKVLYEAGYRGKYLKQAFGIAMRESGGRADAYNGNRGTGDQSYGLFQINMLGDMGPARRKQFGIPSNDALLDPLTNAKAAFQMSNGGKNWGPWGIGPNAYRSDPRLVAGWKAGMAKFPGGAVAPAPSRRTSSVAGSDPVAAALMMGGSDPGRVLSGLVTAEAQRRAAGMQETSAPQSVAPRAAQGDWGAAALGGTKYTDLGGPDAHQARPLGNWESDNAWDYGVPVGTPIYAVADGVIGDNIGVQDTRPKDGKRLQLNSPDNEYWYGHLSRIVVKAGQRVQRGQLIGYSGMSQNGVPHLHLGVKNL